MKIKGIIKYKCKPTHPDIECLVSGKEYEFSETYTIDPRYFWGEDAITDYIKEDLLLVAGGGYDWEHIYDVCFDIRKVA